MWLRLMLGHDYFLVLLMSCTNGCTIIRSLISIAVVERALLIRPLHSFPPHSLAVFITVFMSIIVIKLLQFVRQTSTRCNLPQWWKSFAQVSCSSCASRRSPLLHMWLNSTNPYDETSTTRADLTVETKSLWHRLCSEHTCSHECTVKSISGDLPF